MSRFSSERGVRVSASLLLPCSTFAFFINIVNLRSGMGLVRITDLPDARETRAKKQHFALPA